MIEGLNEVSRIVSHKNCPDGIASAMICHNALPFSGVEFVTYGEESYENLAALPGMLFVDGAKPADTSARKTKMPGKRKKKR